MQPGRRRSPQQGALCECGRDLFTFVTVASSHIMRTLQRPCKSRSGKRRVNHRRFLHGQISRQFADIEAATRRLAASVLAQEVPRDPPCPAEPQCPGPEPPAPAASSFLGVAEAFAAPEPGPSWALSVASLTPDPGDLFDPITVPNDAGLSPSWALITHNPLGPSQSPLPWNPLWAQSPSQLPAPPSAGYPVGVAPGEW